MTISTIDLMRHGEPAGGHYFRGITDDPLTRNGRQQMYDKVAGGKTWDIVISSPLVRCLDFAADFSGRKRIPLIIESGFRELDFGDWEGKTADEVSQSGTDAISGFYTDPFNNTFHNGENLGDFNQRVTNAWNQVIDKYRDKRILIITHAGVMRLLIAQILEVPLKNIFLIQIDYADMIHISCYYEKADVFYQLHVHAD